MLHRFLSIIFLLQSFRLLAQDYSGNLEFTENKGQWASSIRYRADIPNGRFYLHSGGFSVLIQKAGDMEKVRNYFHPHGTEVSLPPFDVHSHIYSMDFVGAAATPQISGDKPLDTKNNYFIGNDSSKWRNNCSVYQAVLYNNIYPGIDLRYYTDKGNLKYNFIVHPGADYKQIRMKYTGATQLLLKGRQLTIKTSVGDVVESVPATYETAPEGNKELDCSYAAAADRTIGFRIRNHDATKTLIIDPTEVFCTFTGSRSDNWGYTATYDEAGNFYSGSIVLSSNFDAGLKFPVTPGAYQTTFRGGNATDGSYDYDIGIMKFSSNGASRIYSTYLGGNGNEQPHSLIVDRQGNLIVAGRSSSTDYPVVNAAAGANQNHGGYDIILSKLNAAGTALLGSILIGGAGNDGVNIAPKYNQSPPMGQQSLRLNYGDDGRSEVILDNAGNICLASCTQSDDFPVTANAFQKKKGTAQDGVFIKTSPGLNTILASSYLGGNGDDAAFALAASPITGDIYVGGATASSNLPGTTNGPVVSATNKGGIDGFLSIISPDGGTLRKTSYFGTTGTDVIYGVQFDNAGAPYIMGTTYGTWPVINAVFKQANGKQFIGKLKTDISAYVYSTTFGKGSVYPDISPTAFLVDRCQNVYVAGWGGGLEVEGGGAAVYKNSKTNGMAVTGDAIKMTTDGDDFYFFVMQRDAASQLYGSYFGQTGGAVGDHVDGGTSRFDKQGVVYQAICANCYGGAKFPSTPGGWSPANGTGRNGCNLAALKISFNFSGVVADPRSLINGVYDSSGCIPLEVVFTDTIHNGKKYVWSFGDGSADTSTTGHSISHTYTQVGNYRVRLISIDSLTCNIADTAYVRIRARTDRALLGFDYVKLPPCASLAYRFLNTSTPPSNKPFGPGSFTWDFGDGTRVPGANPVTHTFANSGTYPVRLIMTDTNYCNSPDSITQFVRVSPIVKAIFDIPNGCAPYTAFINNATLGGLRFDWDFGDGTGSQLVNPVHLYPDTGKYTIRLVVSDSSTCNKVDSTQRTIEVHSKPAAAFFTRPEPAEYNIPTVFTNQSSGAVRYNWLFGDGSSREKNSNDTVIHQYEATGTYQACLVAYNQYECPDTICHSVDALINPLLDVPNAFTPGRFGQNSVITVKGFGIQGMLFKIYNRWGRLVFQSTDPDNGWDGTYQGVPQPMDVYGYTLEAQFFDGTKTTKKGDITLIR